jgi:hypothetical protein
LSRSCTTSWRPLDRLHRAAKTQASFATRVSCTFSAGVPCSAPL